MIKVILNKINLFVLLKIFKIDNRFISPLNWKVPNQYELIYITYPVRPNIIHFKFDSNSNEINQSNNQILTFIHNNSKIISTPNNNIVFNENYWYNPDRNYQPINEATGDFLKDRKLFEDQQVVKENNFYVFKDSSKVITIHGKFITWLLVKAIHHETKILLSKAKLNNGKEVRNN